MMEFVFCLTRAFPFLRGASFRGILAVAESPRDEGKVLKLALFSLIAVGVTAAAIVVAKMGPRNIIGMIRYDQRQEGALRVGDRAPDVELLALDGTTTSRLSQHLGGRPVVLVFGSFT